MQTVSLTRYAWLSIAAAIVTIGLKGAAYLLTGSVGLLSDALESLVNLAAAVLALIMLHVAAQPPDEAHAYGHAKAEYFASGAEGALILVAAVSIAFTAGARLLDPQPIEQLGLGLAVSLAASLINLVVAQVLLRVARQHTSIALEADGKHLMTDVWTSAGVLLGMLGVWLSGWQLLDPLIALVVAANIIWAGARLVHRSALGLMDTALPAEEVAAISAVLERYCKRGVQYHALRTRSAAARRFVSFHILVPGSWTVQRGHQLLEQIEHDVRTTLPNVTVFTHLEPIEDPASFADTQLDRTSA